MEFAFNSKWFNFGGNLFAREEPEDGEYEPGVGADIEVADGGCGGDCSCKPVDMRFGYRA